MSRFVFVNAILPGKTPKVNEMFRLIRNKDEKSMQLAERAASHNSMGVSLWNAWIQHTPKGDLMVQCYQGSSPEMVFAALRAGIQAKSPLALGERNFHLEVTGDDLADLSSTPKVHEVMSLEFPTNKWKSEEHFCIGFGWPLLKGKTQDYEKFCAQEKNDGFNKIRQLLLPYGVTSFIKFIQKTPKQDYVLYYCEFPQSIYEQIISSKKVFEAKANEISSNPEWQKIAKALQEHTGFTEKELIPDIESLGFDHIVIEPALKADWK